MGVSGSGTRRRVDMSIDTTDHGVVALRLNFLHRIGTLRPPQKLPDFGHDVMKPRAD